MARLPEGTITFMLTDLQGSTQAWERHPRAMRGAMARHDAILASMVGNHAGALVEAGREGDSVLAVFRTAGAAAACALEIQKKFASESWPEGLELKVRVALHTGEAQLRGGHYFGQALNRCARLLAACHPGQILLTKATESMVADEVPPGAELQDLGLHRLKDLARPEQIFQLNDLASSIEFPPIRSLPHEQTNLPHFLSTFVGRRAELSELKSLLAKSRLITLTGAGGSGKTRLAAELGRACIPRWPGGVWWVELAPVDDPRQVPGAVVAALQLPGRGPAHQVVTAWLAARKAILVLDNCEHLVAACAEFCQAALERCPELTIIATSREVLGVPGEARWPVLSMPTTDAVQLFEARAQLVVPKFKVAASNRETVAHICDRLDGMPLAIELAAARVDVLTERELLSQLSDRFRLLKGGSRTAPQRQQTMVATIDWSYRLLSEDEALLFRRLSVFRGGFTLESAQAVCADRIAARVLDLLAGLVQKSMVVTEQADGSRSRYRLLESQLAYAEDRLQQTGERELARRRHYEYFLSSLAARPGMTHPIRTPTPGYEQTDWMALESGNLWAALGWARNNADDLGLGLAVDFVVTDITEARRLLSDLLAHSPMQGTIRVLALCRASTFAVAQGEYGAALQAAEAAVALAREVGDVEWVAWALDRVESAHLVRGELGAAAEVLEEATSLLKGSTNLRLLCAIRNSAAFLAIETGDYIGASAILAECLTTARSEGDVKGTGNFLNSLACAQFGMEQYLEAMVSWKEALSIRSRIYDPLGMVHGLGGLSCVAAAIGDDHRALRLGACVGRLSGEWSLHLDDWSHRQIAAAEQRSRLRLGTRRSAEAWTEGWALNLNQAIDYALGESEPQAALDARPLSRREQEVAKLVAAGMTNRQIAQRLFIAERTVDGHLEHVREKLAVNTRAQIAAWAVERGLAPGPATAQGHRPTETRSRTGSPPPRHT
jgi:predicted ATPase/class 3 adenylate cyclase/DNA-binding CsgD family transcriptional regulator